MSTFLTLGAGQPLGRTIESEAMSYLVSAHDSPDMAHEVRRLFEDLELVLVQMARLAPADSTSVGPTQLRPEREERALIDGTMRDVQVMPRLRRAIPAGVGS